MTKCWKVFASATLAALALSGCQDTVDRRERWQDEGYRERWYDDDDRRPRWHRDPYDDGSWNAPNRPNRPNNPNRPNRPNRPNNPNTY